MTDQAYLNPTIASLSGLLKEMSQTGASDLHLRTNSPPMIRLNGKLQKLGEYNDLTPDIIKTLTYSILTDEQRVRFEEKLELDFSFQFKGLSRYRVNFFNERGSIGAVFRVIPFEIKNFDQLGLPKVVEEMCKKPRGLILVTGPTGSGKSTTLASMIDKINIDRQDHILTIEDPIEFIHPHKNCLISQREVSADTHGFAEALRSALRQDPDVVLLGEMRDLETIEMALRIAETGHLTFATLHTNNAASTINRIIDVFPAGQQSQVRTQLSLVLEGVLCQNLLPKASGDGRVMALEVLVPNSAVRNLIREDKVHQIYSVMQTSSESFGMQTFNQALFKLYKKNLITHEVALHHSPNKDEFESMISTDEKSNIFAKPGESGIQRPSNTVTRVSR